jgi:hypothetical protein
VKNVIKLKTKLQLAVDFVKEINLRFEEFQLGDDSIFRQVQTGVSGNSRNRRAVDTSVTSQHLLRHQGCLFLSFVWTRMVVYLIQFCKPGLVLGV